MNEKELETIDYQEKELTNDIINKSILFGKVLLFLSLITLIIVLITRIII